MNKTIRILLIEDNPGDARLLKEMLREADVRFELECVDRLSSGIEKVKSVGFDIILLDLGLPDSRGLVALTRLNEIRPEAPIIVLTGHANESMGIQAVQEGAQDFLVKGQVDKNLLVRSINYAIQRKKIQGALQKSESRLRTLVQTIPDLIWLKDPDGVYLSCNAMFERFFGAKEADIVGKTDYDFVDRELADLFQENDRKAMAAGKPTSNEEWVTFADDGHQALLYTLKTPMLDDKGNVIGILGIAHDITARKQSEETLKETLNRSEMLTQEIVALLKASKAVLENKDFGPTAREIFNECKQLLGATAGYVALLSSDGAENEVLFLDSGGRPCTVDLH